jgi:hypothetical protein
LLSLKKYPAAWTRVIAPRPKARFRYIAEVKGIATSNRSKITALKILTGGYLDPGKPFAFVKTCSSLICAIAIRSLRTK